MIDTVAAPPVGAVALQWFTKAKYLTDLPITYVSGVTVISEKAFRRLSPDDQKLVREVLGEANKNLGARTRSDNQAAREALAKQGVIIVEPTAQTRTRWKEIAATATGNLVAERGYNPLLIAEIEGLLESYRSREAETTGGD